MAIDFQVDFQPDDDKNKLDFQLDFQPDEPTKPKRKTSFKEDVKIALANATNTAGLGLGSLLAPILPIDIGDKWRAQMQRGAKNIEKWANPESAEQTFGGKFAGTVATLPAQILSMPWTPATTGQEFINKGESLPRALAAAGIETLGNMAGVLAPALGAGLPTKAATAFGINAAQDFVTKKLLQATAKNEDTKAKYEPTFEDAVLAGTTGLPLLLVPTGRKSKNTSARVKDIEAELNKPVEQPKVPEQLELPLETAAQTVAEQQAASGAQRDLFAPINQKLDERVAPVTPDTARSPIPNEAQGELPFSTGLDELAATQKAGDVQADLFVNEQPRQTAYDSALANEIGKSTEQLQRLNKEGQQMAIVEDFGNNDPMSRMPEMRVDENGMPIRADLSMEAQNLENPLQRNLWGDELGPALDQHRSLTEAIDSMPSGPERDHAIALLSGQKRVPQSQRGAIDASVFEDMFNFGKSAIRGNDGKLMPLYHGTEQSFRDIKESTQGGALGNGVYLAVRPEYASSYAEGLGGNVHQVYANITNPLVIKGPGDPMVNALVSLGKTREQANKIVEKAYDEKGYITNEVRSLARKAGYDGIVQYRGDVPSEVVAFDKGQVKSAISPEQMKVPAGQRGAVDLQNVIDGARDLLKKIPNLTSADVKEAKAAADTAAKQARVKALLGEQSGYLENVTTPETVVALAPNAKDIPTSAKVGGKIVTPGINALAIKHPNPLVKFMRSKTRDVFVKTDALVERYITGADGIGKTIESLSKPEQVEVVQLLQLGDKKQTKITRELMDKHGFSENQKKFVEQFYDMDAEKLRVWNEKRAEAGMDPVEAREGHVPGIFRGDYKQLVTVDKPVKQKDGSIKIVQTPAGVIAVDFKWQLKAAQEAMSKKFPDAKFSPVKRSELGGSAARGGEFGAMQDVLRMLAEKDPSFKEIQELIASAIAENSDKAYGAAQHALRKKGIVGNEGNKPWLNPEQNAHDFIKAYLQHWEDQMISHAALPVEKQVRALMENPALDNMPNAKEYVDMYLKNMSGRSVGQTGRALNTILDTPSRMLGVGPSKTRAAVHQFNKRMGQTLMGFGNWLFSVTQWLQVAQTGVPEITSAAKQLGVNQAMVIPAMTKAVKDWMAFGFGKDSGEFATTMKEARERGLLTFSEFTDVDKITQNKYSRMADKAIDFNRAELGENPTRPLVFFTAVNTLRASGLEGKALYDAAYNITQAGMFDYRTNERPMMYQRAGVVGTLAGGLQTFKHGYLNQMQRMLTNANKDPVSAAYVVMANLAFAGIAGVPFYQEIDSLFKYLTGKFGDEQNISEFALKALPRWLEKGVISDVTNVNMQNRLSAADILPNSPIEAVSPYFSALGNIGKSAKDVLSFNDQLAWNNMAVAATPQGPLKGLAEKYFLTDDDGYVLNRQGLRGNTRTEWDKNVRTFSGGRSLDEAITGENQYFSGEKLKNYRDKQKSIVEKIQRKYVQGTLTREEMQGFAEEYKNARGDVKQLTKQLINFAKTTKLDKQQRLQGIPNGSLSSLYRYQEYSDDVAK